MNVKSRVGAGILSALLFFPLPAFAQSTPLENPSSRENATAETVAPVVPAELIERALVGDARAFIEMRQFLVGDDSRNPEMVTRRATALIAQIGREKGSVSSDALLRAIDRVASASIDLVSASQVVRIGIDKDFVPTRALVAWDFGPPDGDVAPGFERILPNDSRIAGSGLDGLRRPLESDLLNDGIAGVERIETDLPDGDYRIILLTQNLGDRKMMANPFGSEISVNGVSRSVARPDPDQWLHDAVLTNRGVRDIAVRGSGAPGFRQGFGVTDLDSTFDPALFRRQQGGAVIVQATARGGKLVIELRGFGNARSYLTGVIIEPARQISELVLSRDAVQALMPLELRLALEESILASAADVLADLDPADGDPELVELPEPILDPEELASTSS
jgi:hypothetical protein